MNRTIKFRAWNRNAGLMIIPSEEELGALIKHPELNSEFSLMQYTGFKDKNGKEIWEGDIVRGTTDKWDAETKTCDIVKVKWDEETSGFVPFSMYDSDCCTGTSPNDVEVIGNIYQNKDLLK